MSLFLLWAGLVGDALVEQTGSETNAEKQTRLLWRIGIGISVGVMVLLAIGVAYSYSSNPTSSSNSSASSPEEPEVSDTSAVGTGAPVSSCLLPVH